MMEKKKLSQMRSGQAFFETRIKSLDENLGKKTAEIKENFEFFNWQSENSSKNIFFS